MCAQEIKAYISFEKCHTTEPFIKLVDAICFGLGISCLNYPLPQLHSSLGPTKEKPINEADIFIAIASKLLPRRNDGRYNMPRVVFDEVVIRYNSRRPMLILKEMDVDTRRFVDSHCIYEHFDADDCCKTELLGLIIRSIYQQKVILTSD